MDNQQKNLGNGRVPRNKKKKWQLMLPTRLFKLSEKVGYVLKLSDKS